VGLYEVLENGSHRANGTNKDEGAIAQLIFLAFFGTGIKGQLDA
jgi:hypothetical protein